MLRFSPRPFSRLLFALTPLTLASLAGADCPQFVANGGFESGTTGWSIAAYYDASVSVSVDADPATLGNHYLSLQVLADPSYFWQSDVEMSQDFSAELVEGATYRLRFWARALPEAVVRVKVGSSVDPFPSLGFEDDLTFEYALNGGSVHEYGFEATGSGPAGLVFMLGNQDADITIDGISLTEISSSECGSTGTGGGSGTGGSTGTGNTGGIGGQIFNNQLGYVPGGEKVATLKSGASSGEAWELRDASGTVVDFGTSIVDGVDMASGDSVHLIDFSDFDAPGSGYRLWVGDDAGPPFVIGQDVYAELRRDALRFFYYQRSGEAIIQPYAEGLGYTRAAGHDYSTTCTGCGYSLDTRSGWYDAGDYGKYVVNGGIALWTLLNLHERTEHLGTDLAALGDGQNNIPESGNGESDLLDEARKEIDFLLSMQVPEGFARAGMAHHKVHSSTWDLLPIAPEDAKTHVLQPVSTAATLNLAATAAQCARVFATLDALLSARCLAAAERAYAAAQANPALLASASSVGGGPYNDANVSDEFYWAAAELFITTGKVGYESDLLASVHHGVVPSTGDALAWPTTAALGLISLALVPNELSATEIEALRFALVERAQADALLSSSGYGAAVTEYLWGSNSSVLNAGLVSAVAYDLTGTSAFRATALAALDSVLGRNPLGQSYVTQYGLQPFENPHHRFWAGTGVFPEPPPGVLAGGPNQNSGDWAPGTSSSVSLSCLPSKCWADIDDDYSMTEVTVNWNAPLAWLASWASEQENDPQTVFPGVEPVEPGGGGTGGSSSGGDGDGDGSGGTGSSSGGISSGGDGDEDGDSNGRGSKLPSGGGDAPSGGDGPTSGGPSGDGSRGGDSSGCSYAPLGPSAPGSAWWLLLLVAIVPLRRSLARFS